MTPAAFSIIPFTGNIDDLPEPTNGPYFVAARDGYLVHRTFHFGRILVPTKDASLAPVATPTLWHNIDPPIPAKLLGQAYSFFRAIYETRKSEAMLDITWHPTLGYRLFVPPQQASSGGVKCKRNPEHYNGQIVGTIHSHPWTTQNRTAAFHSGTDTHDADSHDGLHITMGDVLTDNPSIAIMISVAKVRWDFTLDEITDGPLEIHPHPRWWENFVSDPIPTATATSQKYTTAPYTPGTWKPAATPSASTPVVVARPRNHPNNILSIDELLWRYESIFSPEEQDLLMETDHVIGELEANLAQLGIDLITEFQMSPLNHAVDDDAHTTIWSTPS